MPSKVVLMMLGQQTPLYGNQMLNGRGVDGNLCICMFIWVVFCN